MLFDNSKSVKSLFNLLCLIPYVRQNTRPKASQPRKQTHISGSIKETSTKFPKIPRQGVRGMYGQAKLACGIFDWGSLHRKIIEAIVRKNRGHQKYDGQPWPILIAHIKAINTYTQEQISSLPLLTYNSSEYSSIFLNRRAIAPAFTNE